MLAQGDRCGAAHASFVRGTGKNGKIGIYGRMRCYGLAHDYVPRRRSCVTGERLAEESCFYSDDKEPDAKLKLFNPCPEEKMTLQHTGVGQRENSNRQSDALEPVSINALTMITGTRAFYTHNSNRQTYYDTRKFQIRVEHKHTEQLPLSQEQRWVFPKPARMRWRMLRPRRRLRRRGMCG